MIFFVFHVYAFTKPLTRFSTNTPTITSGVGTKGYFWIVDTAGTTNVDGVTEWAVGDWCLFNGVAYEKVDNTAPLQSVAGRTGIVTLTAADILSGTFADARISQSSVTQHGGALNHDTLANYVADKHVAHTSVSINAGTGLSGGGNIAASRTLSLAINTLTETTVPDVNADYFLLWDASESAHRRMLINSLVGNYFASGGDSPSAARSLGNNDAYPLSLLTNGVERITLTADGKVGINTNAPSEALDVVGNVAVSGTVNGVTMSSVVSGPASASDNRVPRYDGASGKLLQHSALSVADNGDISVLGTDANAYVSLFNAGSGGGARMGLEGNQFALHNLQTGDITLHTNGVLRVTVQTDGAMRVHNLAGTAGVVRASATGVLSSVATLGTADLDADAVTLAKMASNAVDSDVIVDGSVTEVDLVAGYARGTANGVATLDGTGKIPTAQIPAISPVSVESCADVACRDALVSPVEGTMCIVADAGAGAPETYIYDGAAWLQMSDPSQVTSVNGQTGVIVLSTSDLSEGSNLYYTSARVTAHTDVAANSAHRTNMANPHGVTKAQVIAAGSIVLSDLAANSVNGAKIVDGSVTGADLAANLAFTGYTQLADVAEPANPGAGMGRLYKKTGSAGLWWKADAAAVAVDVSGGSGETNTASNVGVGGVSVVDGKVGVDLQFKSINAGSTKILISDDVTNNNVDVDVVESNISHDALDGYSESEHINHDNVSVLAGTGLSGGGTIAATRTIDLSIDSLTLEVSPVASDYLAIYNGAAHQKVAISTLPITAAQVGLGNVVNAKSKLDATTSPSVSDDATQGYAVTSVWVNTVTKNKYACIDASTGAAVWKCTTCSSSGVSWSGAWVTSTAYAVDDSVQHDGSSYVCTAVHTSGASSEPGVGASWASYWDLMAAKGASSMEKDVQQAMSVTSTNTSSTTYVDMADMTLTTVNTAATTYEVVFSATLSMSINNNQGSIIMSVDGTNLAYTERMIDFPGSNTRIAATTHCLAVDLADAKIIKVLYKTSGGVISAHARVLSIYGVN